MVTPRVAMISAGNTTQPSARWKSTTKVQFSAELPRLIVSAQVQPCRESTLVVAKQVFTVKLPASSPMVITPPSIVQAVVRAQVSVSVSMHNKRTTTV